MQRAWLPAIAISIALLAGNVLLWSYPSQSTAALPKAGPLDWSLGEWAGTRRDATTNDKVKLQVRVEPILGGKGQIEHLEAQHSDDPYRGFTVRTPAEKAGQWVMHYWNSKRSGFAQLNGEIDASRSTWVSATMDQPRLSRLVSEAVGKDDWRRTMSISEDQGKTWRTLWVDELRRSGKR